MDVDMTLSTGVGTPLYMAPELCDGPGYTSAVDVYGFALMLYEIVTGQRVWPRTITPAMLMKKTLDGTRPLLPGNMNQVVK
jgi:serine/threonine protein kinase